MLGEFNELNSIASTSFEYIQNVIYEKYLAFNNMSVLVQYYIIRGGRASVTYAYTHTYNRGALCKLGNLFTMFFANQCQSGA